MDPLFLTLVEVLEIHTLQIDFCGGPGSVRCGLPFTHLPAPPVRGWEQADWRERRHHISADQRLESGGSNDEFVDLVLAVAGK